MVIVAFGTRRERYDSAYEVQCYSGIAPVNEASGKTSWVHFRRACPMFLRQTFHEFALHSIGQSEWAKAYYDHLRKDEKRRITQQSGAWRTNGFASSFDAGRTVSRTMRRCI